MASPLGAEEMLPKQHYPIPAGPKMPKSDNKIPQRLPTNPPGFIFPYIQSGGKGNRKKEFICYMQSTFTATKDQKLKGLVGFFVWVF